MTFLFFLLPCNRNDVLAYTDECLEGDVYLAVYSKDC